MPENKKSTVYVIGHTNPDTDSICSAIAYAALKRKLTGERYSARRAGQMNSETRFVLKRFGVMPPAYLPDVRPQVRDIEIRKVEGVDREISLKRAWEQMQENNVVTLPILHPDGRLEGLITTSDLVVSYMDVYDSHILTTAGTTYHNIVETLEGELLVGDPDHAATEGKVLIAAANPDLMENYIEENDIVILGNRYESQLCAIEMSAQCIIVCEGAPVSRTITKLAQERGCYIIRTPYDTFTVARLIHQSIPVRYFMKTNNLVTFHTENFIDDIRSEMTNRRFRDFPILDKEEKFVGMISRRNLLGARKKQLILVDHNEVSQAVDGLKDAEILEIIDHHRLGSLETMSPVFFRNQPLGCTATIVAMMYEENNVEIPPDMAGLLCSAILSDTLVYRSPTCTELDRVMAERLARIAGIDTTSYAMEMFEAGSNLQSKSAEEIFYQDYKKFSAGELRFAVGQINSMSGAELENIRERLLTYMEKAFREHDVSMLFFMMTDIMESSTTLLYQGTGAEETVREAFRVEPENGQVWLQGVVSRKKQLIPALMSALQTEN